MNNVNNVALGKPKIGGAIFRAPLGTVIPADASTELPVECIAQGYVSSDGVERAISRSFSSQLAWGGDEVAAAKTEETIRLNFALIEANNLSSLRSAYGDSAVSTTGEVTTVAYKGEVPEDSTWIIDMEYNGILRRIVFPHSANVTEDFTQTFTDEELIQLPFSLAARRDSTGVYFYDHFETKEAGDSGVTPEPNPEDEED